MARAADAGPKATGAPVGRRLFLTMVGLAGAGVVFGSKAQDWLEHALAPITARDGTGLSSFLPVGRFRIYQFALPKATVGVPYSFTAHARDIFEYADKRSVRDKVATARVVIAISEHGGRRVVRCR